MPEALTCPSCAGRLEVEGEAATVRCAYCGHTIVVPDGLRGGEAPDEIETLLRAGRKIEAIKRHRELHGSGLKEAKEAVEQMAAERGLPGAEAGSQRGCFLLAVLLLLAVALALYLILAATPSGDQAGRQVVDAVQVDDERVVVVKVNAADGRVVNLEPERQRCRGGFGGVKGLDAEDGAEQGLVKATVTDDADPVVRAGVFFL